jgi:hypothetical protein
MRCRGRTMFPRFHSFLIWVVIVEFFLSNVGLGFMFLYTMHDVVM